MAKKEAIDARHYDVILAPHITEKSTLASEHFACWGFGEVYPDGFGVGYMCNKNSFAATVTAVSGVGATAMGEQIQRALRDMHAVALSARKAAKL